MKILNYIPNSIKYLGLLAAGLLLGWLFFGQGDEHSHSVAESEQTQSETWTCSMHPQIRQEEPGQCPICGMDLVRVSSLEGDEKVLTMTAEAVRLASIQTTTVAPRAARKEIYLSGRIAINEDRLFSQTAHFPGRIESMIPRHEGDIVRKGQKIASFYSPRMITAQEELLEAYSSRDKNPALYKAARTKLRLWKLTDRQIDAILKAGEVSDEVDIHSDFSGVVMDLNVAEGDHAMEGTILYKVADLSRLWVHFDAYEDDLPDISEGDEIHFTVRSIPGSHFHGKIVYIDPLINPDTRTTTIRAVVENRRRQLKPDMFAEGTVTSEPGDERSVSVPASSVLWTGTRSVVYVQLPEYDQPAFELREITLGDRMGEYYIVLEGLKQGDVVVTNGAFTVDAAAQLSGHKSMMNPGIKVHLEGQSSGNEPAASATGEIDPEFRLQLQKVYQAYLNVKDALVETDAASATKAAGAVIENLDAVDMSLVTGRDHMKWMELLANLKASAINMQEPDIEKQREQFSELTENLVNAIRYFGVKEEKIYYQYCPMAFDFKGDYWLSNEEAIQNPYFGDKMLTCGEVAEVIEPMQ